MFLMEIVIGEYILIYGMHYGVNNILLSNDHKTLRLATINVWKWISYFMPVVFRRKSQWTETTQWGG